MSVFFYRPVISPFLSSLWIHLKKNVSFCSGRDDYLLLMLFGKLSGFTSNSIPEKNLSSLIIHFRKGAKVLFDSLQEK